MKWEWPKPLPHIDWHLVLEFESSDELNNSRCGCACQSSELSTVDIEDSRSSGQIKACRIAKVEAFDTELGASGFSSRKILDHRSVPVSSFTTKGQRVK